MWNHTIIDLVSHWKQGVWILGWTLRGKFKSHMEFYNDPIRNAWAEERLHHSPCILNPIKTNLIYF